MVGQTYELMNSLKDSDKVRIGYRQNDFLEDLGCRKCFQKSVMATTPWIMSYVWFKEYELKYGHYPIIRLNTIFRNAGFKQMLHYTLPLIGISVGVWWSELAYNRCVIGVQGAKPISDQILS